MSKETRFLALLGVIVVAWMLTQGDQSTVGGVQTRIADALKLDAPSKSLAYDCEIFWLEVSSQLEYQATLAPAVRECNDTDGIVTLVRDAQTARGVFGLPESIPHTTNQIRREVVRAARIDPGSDVAKKVSSEELRETAKVFNAASKAAGAYNGV